MNQKQWLLTAEDLTQIDVAAARAQEGVAERLALASPVASVAGAANQALGKPDFHQRRAGMDH